MLNVFGNYVFIFGAFGFPEWGVAGVALSTVVSRVLAMIILAVLLYFRLEVSLRLERFLQAGTEAYGENSSYRYSLRRGAALL
ncbi:hypothetical protein [Sinobaca sp. H24]|uniref:hypothetical protein n=1 Tax=Sinobaca sp. H24 TaxID=2923376 RepID=UPI0020798555|nr:hypothetical protein [Sinobaca sp. H24]